MIRQATTSFKVAPLGKRQKNLLDNTMCQNKANNLTFAKSQQNDAFKL